MWQMNWLAQMDGRLGLKRSVNCNSHSCSQRTDTVVMLYVVYPRVWLSFWPLSSMLVSAD